MNNNGNNGNGRHGEPVLADLSIPGVKWEDNEYATLKMRLDLYTDVIIGCKYERGVPGPRFAVDPTALAGALTQLPVGTGLLPPNCLFWSRKGGQERLGVYVEPQVWPVSVQGQAETWRVPLPGLVFVGQGLKYQLYAAKERPKLHDRLYIAPVPNMSSHVCRGNAPFPYAAAGTIWDAVQVFFESGFNRDLSNGKSQHYCDDIVDHWQALHEGGAQEYPLDDLVPAGVSMSQLME